MLREELTQRKKLPKILHQLDGVRGYAREALAHQHAGRSGEVVIGYLVSAIGELVNVILDMIGPGEGDTKSAAALAENEWLRSELRWAAGQARFHATVCFDDDANYHGAQEIRTRTDAIFTRLDTAKNGENT